MWKMKQPKTLIWLKRRTSRFKKGQRKCSCIRRQIMPIRNNNRKKSMRFTTSQHEISGKNHICSIKMSTPTEHNLPVREKIH